MENKEKVAFKLFNEGVKYSLDAEDEFENGKIDPALILNKKAIDKFLETYKTDSTHQLVKSALGHSYYLQKDYKNGIYWYELANKLDSPLAVSYRELGLCKINLGDIKDGTSDLENSFKLDNSNENKQITILDLKDIGNLAFKYGEDYEKEGEKEKGLGYKKFAIGVLWVASNFDTTNLEIKKRIAEYAENIGDLNTAEKFKAK
jgi:tetratricopeptide (TPR) repeat protein